MIFIQAGHIPVEVAREFKIETGEDLELIYGDNLESSPSVQSGIIDALI